mmetsp:Transcript_110318/g.312980  ORF Transcript_110318/g.312980 Transcript_110318/m.312980 type:complete len:246 (-) Transcript_110318:2-739(-)
MAMAASSSAKPRADNLLWERWTSSAACGCIAKSLAMAPAATSPSWLFHSFSTRTCAPKRRLKACKPSTSTKAPASVKEFSAASRSTARGTPCSTRRSTYISSATTAEATSLSPSSRPLRRTTSNAPPSGPGLSRKCGSHQHGDRSRTSAGGPGRRASPHSSPSLGTAATPAPACASAAPPRPPAPSPGATTSSGPAATTSSSESGSCRAGTARPALASAAGPPAVMAGRAACPEPRWRPGAQTAT